MSRAPAKKTTEKTVEPKVEKKTWERVARGERVVLRRGKRPVAAVVPLSDLKALEELENALDLEAAEQGSRDAQTNGTISLAELKKRLGDD